MTKYSVRIGKTNPVIFVRTPKGAVLRFKRVAPTRDDAKRLAARVRKHLNAGGKLDPKRWVISRKP